MGRKLGTVLALGLVTSLVFALAPGEAERSAPPAPAVSLGAGAGTLVVDLVDGAGEADLQTVEALLGADLDWTHPLSVDEALAEGWVADVPGALAMLSGHPLVEVAEPEIVMEAYGNYPNDPMYDRQWHLRAMGAPEAWSATSRGQGVVVAVVDTGVSKVEDMDGTEILKGASFVPGTRSAADDQGHGTHVAGTIAQTTNNGKGVAGVAPDATILPVKVLSKFGFGSASWIAAGIDYAADEGADVINLSLGGGYSSVIHNAIKKARKKGVIVVAAAGNSGNRGVGYPGALEETIGVSATGPDGKLAPYSSYGKGVDIAAPGGDKRKPGGGVLQNTVDGKGGDHYVEYQGTSMATPHVAGAAAVLLGQGMAADAVERTLLDTARGDSWNERYGHGHLDLAAATKGAVKRGGTQFALGAVFALLIAQLAATRRRFQLGSAGVAGWLAGGLFFLTALPIPDLAVLGFFTKPFLEWPSLLALPEWVHFPLWLSAVLPFAVAFTLGAFKGTRPLAFGLVCGVGAHLLYGAATSTLDPWWLPASLGTLWLILNATACGVLALGLAGAQKLDEGTA
ncbi:MAG: S8 family peptidase [Myxococcales bacterium]|nr:S8 family peptidase [Myxococcales bacterium]